MVILEDILSQEIIQKLGWTLLHFIWQAAVAASLLAILLRVLRKSTANLRYIIACLALALIVILPVITIQLVPVSVPHMATHIEPAPATVILSIEEMPAAETIVVEEPVQSESIALVSSVSWKQRTIDTLEPALPYIVSGWLVGVFGLSVWHLGGWAQLQRLRRKMVKQVDYTLHSKLKDLAERLKVNRMVQLMESALVQIPTVVGWLRPVILLPASALTGLSSEQLEAILAHELAHIKRFDYLINMLQTVVEILGFYHPAVWWISHKIRAERENCCDDLAVSISGDRVCYARALTSMEEIRTGHGQLAVAASGGNLFRRIRRLVGKDSAEKTSFSWMPAVTAILLIAALLIPTALALTAKSDSLQPELKTDVQVEGEETASAEKSGPSKLTADKTQILHFPKDQAVGTLKVRDISSDDDADRGLLSLPGWVILGQAQGDVSVPAGKDLRLEVAGDITDFSFLADLKPNDLQVLILSHKGISDEELVQLKGLNGLLGLDLGSTAIKGPGLVHLSTLTSLRKLSLFNTQVSDAGLENLSTLKSLKYLNLYITQVKGPGLKHLKSLTSLVRLDLAATPITNQSLVHLAEMTWLKELELQDTEIGDKGLAHLKPLRSLEELILGYADLKQGYSPITDEGLVYLKELGSLKHLYLLRTRVTDAGLAHLRNLKKLEALLLTETQIKGEGLAFLKDLPALNYLDMNKTGVTDESLVYLNDLKSLRTLYIPVENLSRTDLEELEKALPNCAINGQKPIATIRPPKSKPVPAENEQQSDSQVEDNILLATEQEKELSANRFPVPLPAKSPTPSAQDKTIIQIDFLMVEVFTDLKMDRETTIVAENILGNKVSLRDSKVDVILRKAAEATAAIRKKSAENKRLTQDQFKALTDMLTSRGYMKILMNPRIQVLDGKTAKIISTQKISSTQESIEDSIQITPHVFADGHITLQVEATISSKSIPKGVEQIPIVTTREVSTRVRTSSGESRIIGGLTEKDPAPGDNVKNSKKRTAEVLFILTPTIITPATDSQEKTDTKYKAKSAKSAEKLKRLGLALIMYANDHDNKLPDTLEPLKPYIANEQDYLWIVNNVEYIGKSKTYLPNQPRIPVAYEKTLIERQSGTNVVFLDGHVEFLTPQRLKELGISANAILIETRLLSVSEDFLKDIGLDANSVDSYGAWSEHLVADSTAEPNSETYSLILDDLHISFLLRATQAHEGAKMLAAPRVTVLEGKEARIAIQRAIHYILGYAEPNRPSDKPVPKLDKVELGTRIWLKPELTPDNENIKLDFKLEIRQLLGYEERKYKGKYPYKIPKVDVVSTKMLCLIPDGKTLLIAGLKIIEQVEHQSDAPRLSDLPLIGVVFSRSTKTRDNKMLLILVKPTINPQQKASKILSGEADSEEHIKHLGSLLEKKLNRPAEPK